MRRIHRHFFVSALKKEGFNSLKIEHTVLKTTHSLFFLISFFYISA